MTLTLGPAGGTGQITTTPLTGSDQEADDYVTVALSCDPARDLCTGTFTADVMSLGPAPLHVRVFIEGDIYGSRGEDQPERTDLTLTLERTDSNAATPASRTLGPSSRASEAPVSATRPAGSRCERPRRARRGRALVGAPADYSLCQGPGE